MVWEPNIAGVDLRNIAPNFFTFFEGRKAELKTWAGITSPDDWTLYQTAEMRMKTDFPHTGLVRRRVGVDSKADGHHVRLEWTFETEVAATHGEDGRSVALAELQYDTDSHALAVESVALNIPATVLYANVPNRRGDYRQVTTNDPLEVAVSKTQSMFNVQQTFVMQFIVGHRG
jgi:hypothetical protein